jgi:hypothetical protein
MGWLAVRAFVVIRPATKKRFVTLHCYSVRPMVQLLGRALYCMTYSTDVMTRFMPRQQEGLLCSSLASTNLAHSDLSLPAPSIRENERRDEDTIYDPPRCQRMTAGSTIKIRWAANEYSRSSSVLSVMCQTLLMDHRERSHLRREVCSWRPPKD